MVSSQDPFPLKWSKHSLQWHPGGTLRWAMHTPLCPGGRGKVLPLPHCSTLSAHEEATLPCVSCHDGHCRRPRCHSHCNCRCRLCRCCHCHHRCRQPSPLLLLLAIAVAIGHHSHCHHCRCCNHCKCFWPLPLSSPLAIAITVAVGHHHHHHRCRQPSPSLLPSLPPLPLL
jgi:hypothetical protein